MSQFICPTPEAWIKISKLFKKEIQRNGLEIPSPPKALILGGWAGSSDFEKKARWEDTLSWAEEYGLSQLIPELKPEEKYEVEEIDFKSPLDYQFEVWEAVNDEDDEIDMYLKSLKSD